LTKIEADTIDVDELLTVNIVNIFCFFSFISIQGQKMAQSDSARLTIDLDRFKLHLNLPGQNPFSLHFDTPSRRFYLSVIALVVEEMRKNRGMGSVPLEKHAEVLALLNETVGEGAGSSTKKSLFPRIYSKWKAALPDLENAPLFKVIGVKKGYDEAFGNVYRFDEKSKDAWANLFEYKGSREKVRLRFSVERLGLKLEDVVLVYGKPSEREGSTVWDSFLESLRSGRRRGSLPAQGKDAEEDADRRDAPAESLKAFDVGPQGMDLPQDPDYQAVSPGFERLEDIKKWIERQDSIEKIPLKTRLDLIARLAIAPVVGQEGAKSHEAGRPGNSPSRAPNGAASSETGRGPGSAGQGLEILFQGMFQAGVASMPYRAPELQDGQPPSARSEVYALGVLMYQMVVGDLSRPLDPNWAEAVQDDILRQEIAAAVEIDPDKRIANPAMLSQRLRNLEERRRLLLAEGVQENQKQEALLRGQRMRRHLAYGSLFAMILALLTWFGVYHQKVSQVEAAKKTAYETALPRIKQLIEEEKYPEAYASAREIEKVIPDNPTLQQYINDATNTFDIETMPARARVSYRPYNDLDGPWVELGAAPIQAAAIPLGMARVRIEKQGYATREVTLPVAPRYSMGAGSQMAIGFSNVLEFDLYEKNRVPDGMVPVDGGRFFVGVKGVPATEAILNGPFFIDQFEVTNRAYKEFVDLGGYSDPRYWKEEFKKDGNTISWDEAVNKFVDRTGCSGPATWERGEYPQGQDDYPVSGISWYEAAAYARFRGKTLPTLYHWARAAFSRNELLAPLSPWIISQSNIEGTTVAPVGSFPGIASSGASDMAGNMREWCWNEAGEGTRYCLGGSWQDPAYIINDSCTPSAWDRSETNGFRCALYPADAPPSEAQLKPANFRFHDAYTIPPRTKESLETIKKMFAYEKGPLNPVVESRKPGGKGWVREKVTIDAAYDNERLVIYLDLPTGCPPPYKAVIYFPGVGALVNKTFSRSFLWEPWDLIPENGRALISPIYSGCYERGGEKPFGGKKTFIQLWFDRLNDLRRTIDYLETRKDIDVRNLAFLGLCWGGIEGPKISPYEGRIKSLILISGGFYMPVAWGKPDALTQCLTEIPVLMLNGKYDYVMTVETHQKPLFELIATPPEHKKHVIYDCGHLPLPQGPMMKEIFAWLDKYQGPVECDGDQKADATKQRK
jgi:eukaryotic-like serine/threonine-protein kinase